MTTSASSYVVLARKYRSKQFPDIVGQQAVVRTLVNAIQLKRTHQAYVFSGSRGIGKTSIARIFAKALRCPNVVLKDGMLISCDACPDCNEIAQGNSVNVLEIDGASNNGVDAVREIRESAKFLPTSGQYKIYIIDEVHMLSTAAFNALLKTLEEPPEHVVFIFATTESHKIPETILGRCQRFDFKRMTLGQITDRLKEVLKAERITFEDAALMLIARAAEGSMRDALSILDQVISFSGLQVTAKAVRDSIGLVGTELVTALVRNILNRQAPEALGIVQTAFHQGVDLKVVLKMALEMLHAIILMQVGISKPETPFSDDELEQLRTLVSARPLEENEMIFQVFHFGIDTLAKASQPKLVMDLLVVKTALAEVLVPLDGVQTERPEQPRPHQAPAPAPALKAQEVKAPVVQAPEPQAPKTELTWESVIEKCFDSKPVLAVMLESVVEFTLPQAPGDALKLGFRATDKTKAEQLQQKIFKDQLIQVFETQFKLKPTIEVFLTESKAESLVEKKVRAQAEARDQKIKTIMANEVVQEAKALFGGDLQQIEIIE